MRRMSPISAVGPRRWRRWWNRDTRRTLLAVRRRCWLPRSPAPQPAGTTTARWPRRRRAFTDKGISIRRWNCTTRCSRRPNRRGTPTARSQPHLRRRLWNNNEVSSRRRPSASIAWPRRCRNMLEPVKRRSWRRSIGDRVWPPQRTMQRYSQDWIATSDFWSRISRDIRWGAPPLRRGCGLPGFTFSVNSTTRRSHSCGKCRPATRSQLRRWKRCGKRRT